MAETSLPYVQAYGNIGRVLEKIINASTPPRFTQDFLATTLDMSGGGAKPLIPFLKKTGFLGSDGTPTELYKRFRNPASRGAAAAEALRTGYKPLYRSNEYVHDAKQSDLKGLIVQVTGAEAGSSTVRAMAHSFEALKGYANFRAGEEADAGPAKADAETASEAPESQIAGLSDGLRLGYTINLNLPATSDVAVFNAIFKSLREHLLQ